MLLKQLSVERVLSRQRQLKKTRRNDYKVVITDSATYFLVTIQVPGKLRMYSKCQYYQDVDMF